MKQATPPRQWNDFVPRNRQRTQTGKDRHSVLVGKGSNARPDLLPEELAPSDGTRLN
jgi:hypothetical protein